VVLHELKPHERLKQTDGLLALNNDLYQLRANFLRRIGQQLFNRELCALRKVLAELELVLNNVELLGFFGILNLLKLKNDFKEPVDHVNAHLVPAQLSDLPVERISSVLAVVFGGLVELGDFKHLVEHLVVDARIVFVYLKTVFLVLLLLLGRENGFFGRLRSSFKVRVGSVHADGGHGSNNL